MARMARVEVFAPDEIAIVHVMNRTVRRCFLMGDDPLTGKNYNHRKEWVEKELQRLAAWFGVDLLCYSILSSHFHLVLRSRPDIVQAWDDTEVARRWWMLCPLRRHPQTGQPEPPSEAELNMIRNHPQKLSEIRSRLSDISWWMRLLCQRIAQRANYDDQEVGKFWQARFRAVRLLDETALLACATYVDLNPIRAAMAETLEDSNFTSVQRRIESLPGQQGTIAARVRAAIRAKREAKQKRRPAHTSLSVRPDGFLSPIEIDERHDAIGPALSHNGCRASDKGFLSMPTAAYLDLLDWTARQLRAGKRGRTPGHLRPLFERLGISAATWCELVKEFGRLFYIVAGQPHRIESHCSRHRHHRYKARARAHELLAG